MGELKFNIVRDIYLAGYMLSTLAVLIAFGIFSYYPSLRSKRVKIHMNLFGSFALSNITWIIWYKTIVNTATVVEETEVWCQMIHFIMNYFMVTNYFWMFCEGLHLHLSLVMVFKMENVTMIWFESIGWGFSLLIVAVYGAARYVYGVTGRCWFDRSETFWIILTPVVISMIVSSVFLINAIRILVTKLHPPPNQNISVTAKKVIRAALMLVPLFGLHFLLIPLQPSPEAPEETIYEAVTALLTTLQGVCVATLFCFSNNDVILTIKAHMEKIVRVNEEVEMNGEVTEYENEVHTRETAV